MNKTSFLEGAAEGVKRFLVGHPAQAWDQLQKGKLLDPGHGLLRKAFTPSGPMDAALMYGLPAYSAYNAMQSPAGHRGSMLGQLGGSIAGGFLGQPLGMVGQMAGSTLLGNLGDTVGRQFDKEEPPQSS